MCSNSIYGDASRIFTMIQYNFRYTYIAAPIYTRWILITIQQTSRVEHECATTHWDSAMCAVYNSIYGDASSENFHYDTIQFQVYVHSCTYTRWILITIQQTSRVEHECATTHWDSAMCAVYNSIYGDASSENFHYDTIQFQVYVHSCTYTRWILITIQQTSRVEHECATTHWDSAMCAVYNSIYGDASSENFHYDTIQFQVYVHSCTYTRWILITIQQTSRVEHECATTHWDSAMCAVYNSIYGDASSENFHYDTIQFQVYVHSCTYTRWIMNTIQPHS